MSDPQAAVVMRDPQRLFAAASVRLEERADGTRLLSSTQALGAFPRCLGELLIHWARVAPERSFLCERDERGNWRSLSYAQALAEVERLGRWLLGHGVATPERPVAILCENSIEHALLTFAAMHVGVPAMPVSPAYSLQSRDFAKLKSIIARACPCLIYVDDLSRYAAALNAISGLHAALLVTSSGASPCADVARFNELDALASIDELHRAFAAVDGDTIAKLLFTSGSTGQPKGVLNTQRMLCSNQQAKAQVWPFLEATPPVIVDWLPWNHTFGGNHNLNLVLRNGGTLYIDAGRPVPGMFTHTVRNLREIAPSVYFNVPRGYDMLIAALRADEALRRNFFSRLQLVFYAAASLPQHLFAALRELSRETVGEAVPLSSGWGSTETAPLATDCHFAADQPGVIGLPVPGCELKLVPSSGKHEVRIRGALVTPGYWGEPQLTADSFDAEGFYKIGDAVRLVDEARPELGLLFDGRVAEDFKLTSGTWVHVGRLRLRALAALAPLAQDVVIAGHDRDEICLLIFPDLAACRTLGGTGKDTPADALIAQPAVRAQVARGLLALRRDGTGSSTWAMRAVLLGDPPSIDAGEITDKGYINQRAVLAHRASEVSALYVPGHPAVIGIATGD